MSWFTHMKEEQPLKIDDVVKNRMGDISNSLDRAEVHIREQEEYGKGAANAKRELMVADFFIKHLWSSHIGKEIGWWERTKADFKNRHLMHSVLERYKSLLQRLKTSVN